MLTRVHYITEQGGNEKLLGTAAIVDKIDLGHRWGHQQQGERQKHLETLGL